VIILSIRTDKPEAEVGLFDDNDRLAYIEWHADRQLSDTIHDKLFEILNKSSKKPGDINGIVVYKGPGSFAGLRIGISVANALAYSLEIPIIARAGEQWQQKGIKDLLAGHNDKIALPKYGAPANTTKPKK
jgi:tRNA threonylcarbamoyl adenosine modification protein YeaZ